MRNEYATLKQTKKRYNSRNLNFGGKFFLMIPIVQKVFLFYISIEVTRYYMLKKKALKV